jgi:hypothetical protein
LDEGTLVALNGRIAARVDPRRLRLLTTLQGLDQLFYELCDPMMTPFRWAGALIGRCSKLDLPD